MAIKIIKEPPTVYTIECDRCDCVFSYNLEDTVKYISCIYIRCPKCKEELLHNNRKKYAEGGEWVSVDERLPPAFVSVLVYMPDETPHPTVTEGFVNKRGEWYAGGYDRLPDEVVMWREMPEAPKMKGGDTE